MTHHSKIHGLRQSLGMSRQSVHSPALESLQQELDSMGLEHPYTLERGQIDQLMTNEFFAQGGRGLSASALGHQYLYRICNVRQIVDNTSWISANRYENNEDIWISLKRDFDAAGDWLPLSRYAYGALLGYRGFTWWTSLNFLAAGVICGAHVAGIPNDWLQKYAIILRCLLEEIEGKDMLRVPTVLDAFNGEIFHPTINDDSPVEGLTISLEDPANLETGTDEFVLPGVGVDQIDLWPVLIDRNMRESHNVQLDATLLASLETYYSSLAR
jgi:hypothetical protein